jgi:hypothetical protein
MELDLDSPIKIARRSSKGCATQNAPSIIEEATKHQGTVLEGSLCSCSYEHPHFCIVATTSMT